jgi:hypothetical protein
LSSRGRYEDIATLLYVVPFAVSAGYGLVVWFQEGISIFLPAEVYMTVTRSSYVFLVGSLAVLAGVVLEFRGTDPAERRTKVGSLGSTLQLIAGVSIFFALVGAVYANGASPVGAVVDFMGGKFNLIFPAILFLLSYAITLPFQFSSLAKRKPLAMIVLLLVPVSIYEIGKREIYLGLGVAFALLVVGTLLYVLPEGARGAEEE